jgi:hypothetical protein
MVAPLRIEGGISIGGGIAVGIPTGSSTPNPATNTGGFTLTVIAGLPQNLYPGISVYQADCPPGQFVILNTNNYGSPAGFTFLSNWQWSQYDPVYVAVTTTNTTNDTATALGSLPVNNAALGNVVIANSSKVMFSVIHSNYSGAGGDGVGVGSATTNYSGPSTACLGADDQALAIYDDGREFTNDAYIGSGYEVFQITGQIIDVAVDTVNNKMWYRVDGGAWQG